MHASSMDPDVQLRMARKETQLASPCCDRMCDHPQGCDNVPANSPHGARSDLSSGVAKSASPAEAPLTLCAASPYSSPAVSIKHCAWLLMNSFGSSTSPACSSSRVKASRAEASSSCERQGATAGKRRASALEALTLLE